MMPRPRSSPVAIALFSCSLAPLAGCGAPPEPASPPPVATAAPTAAPVAPPPTAPTTSARDPKIVALATDVLSTCKYEDDAFETECPALKPWEDEEEAFADGKGDATVFAMLGDPDVKLRRLATDKNISDAFWQDKAHVLALVELVKAEKDTSLQGMLGRLVADVDWQTLGLADTLKDLAQHGSQPVRRAIGVHAFGRFVTPATVEAIRVLVDDADPHVADQTVEEMWKGDAQPPVCDLLVKLMRGGDYRQSTAIMAASHARKCAGMTAIVVAELDKRLADPGKVDTDHSRGWDYLRAARHVCLDAHEAGVEARSTPPAGVVEKKQALALLKKFTAPAIADTRSRSRALGYYVECDPKGGPAFVRGFVRDKAIGKDAKELLDGLAAKKK